MLETSQAGCWQLLNQGKFVRWLCQQSHVTGVNTFDKMPLCKFMNSLINHQCGVNF